MRSPPAPAHPGTGTEWDGARGVLLDGADRRPAFLPRAWIKKPPHAPATLRGRHHCITCDHCLSCAEADHVVAMSMLRRY